MPGLAVRAVSDSERTLGVVSVRVIGSPGWLIPAVSEI